MKILFTGGGTGGHIMPIIAVTRELRRLYDPGSFTTEDSRLSRDKNNLAFYYIGPKDDFSVALLQEHVKIYHIVSGKIRRYFTRSGFSISQINLATLFKNIIDILFKIPFGFLQSFFWLLFIHPQLVFSKGGTGSVLVTFSARLLRIPVFLHESDITPGLSNRITSTWAKRIFITFEKTAYFDPLKTILVGNPIKKELLEGDTQSAKEIFNLTFEKPILLFFGGSQGAKTINEFVLLILNDILKDYEIIHICGKKNYRKTQLESRAIISKDLEQYYHLYASLSEVELKHAYKACDLIISRAGSGSIFEIAALGKPSILIPLPSSAGDHQSKNAYQYAQTGAAIIIEQDNVTPNFFMGKIQYLLSQPEKINAMKDTALTFSKPLAAEAIAGEILEYLTNNH